MPGYRPDPTRSADHLLHQAVNCLIAALDAEAVRDPLRMNIVSRFLTGTTPAEAAATQRPSGDPALWTPEQKEAAADALLTSLAEHMGVTEDEALRQIGDHWGRHRA